MGRVLLLAFQLGTAFLLLVQVIQLVRPGDFSWSLNIGWALEIAILTGGLGMLFLASLRPTWLMFCVWLVPLPLLAGWMTWNALTDHSLSGWLVGILGFWYWLVWYCETLLIQAFPRIWPLCAIGNFGWLGWLYVDGYYFQFTGAHLSLYQIFLIGDIEPAGIPQLVGISPDAILVVVRNAVGFICFTLLVAWGVTWGHLHPPRGRGRLGLTALILLAVFWTQFDFLVESRPIGEYLGWRIEMGLFPLPQPSRFAVPAMRRAQAPHQPIVTDGAPSFAWRADAPKYNIVLLLVESWRADHFEPFMPRTVEVSRRGIQLQNLQSQANGTVFSLAGLYSGKHPIDFFRIYRGADESPWLTFLKDSGYRLTRFSWDFERVDGLDRQFISRRFPGDDMTGNTRRMLEETVETLKQPGPHLIEAYLYNTHFAYFFPPEFASFTPIVDERLPELTIAPSEDLRLRLRNRYKNAIGYLDFLLGTFFTRIHAAGLDERTVFVVVGDHGESLGEDAGFGHCSGPHLSQYRIPGFILAPAIPPQEIPSVTQHLDLLPTIGRLTGFTTERLPGRDVRDVAISSREAILQADTSTANRLILRRAERMSLFQIDVRGQLHWIITTRNDFTLDPPLLSLYEKSGIASLASAIEADRALILRLLQGS